MDTDYQKLQNKQINFFNQRRWDDVYYRVSLLEKLKTTIETYEDEIIKALHNDLKKPPAETYATELLVVYKELNTFIKKIKTWQKPTYKLPSLINFPSVDFIHHKAWGQVLIISPWNYPFQLAINPLIAALACGNTVILKPSEFSTHTSAILKKIIGLVFSEEIAQVCLGDAGVASKLLALKWDYIFFTGSVKVGKIVAEAAAKNLTPTTLELGGKNPCIVDSSAKLDIAAKRIVWGKFINAGQTCIAPDYLIVHENIKNQLVEKIIAEIRNFYGNQPNESPDFARIINLKHFQRLIQLFHHQENIRYGGKYNEDDLYISPTILISPDLNDEVMQQEIFGPILPILTFADENELHHVLKNHPAPLSFYIFTENRYFSNQLLQKYKFGGAVLNDTIVHFINDRLPFGGVGNSGVGSYHGKHSFFTFTRKTSVVDRKTWLDIKVKYAPYAGKLDLLRRVKKWIT